MQRWPIRRPLGAHRLPLPVAAILSVALLVGCSDTGGDPAGPAPDLVVRSVQVTPASASLNALGLTSQFSAAAANAAGANVAGKTFTWSSSNAAVATVDANGLATAVGDGTANITASVDGVTGTATLVVAQEAVSLTLTPASDTLASLGDTTRLVADVLDSQNQSLPAPAIAWMSSDTLVATVDTTGLVTSVDNGTASIVATSGSAVDTTAVTVAQVPASVAVTPTATTFASLGDTARIAAAVLDARSVAIADSTVTWASSSATVASVDATGLVTAVANGTTSVSATFGVLADTAAITVAQVPNSVTATAGDGQSAVVSTATAVTPAVRVDDARANPIAGVVVTFAVATGGGTITGGTDTTDTDGLASVGSWTVGATAGTNTLTATATGTGITGNPVTFTATGVTTLFDIVVRYVAGTTPTAAQRTAFDNAAAFWRTVVVGDLSDIPLNLAAATCGGVSAPAVNETVDDLLIHVSFEAIDGAGGTLGSAGPCQIRTANTLPIMGGMRFDTADLPALEASGDLGTTIRHEMGHVLGFGALWTSLGLLLLPSDPTQGGVVGNDTHFNGPEAITAFDEVGGTGYGGNKVPVENDNAMFGTGSLDGHWREGVFSTELMTPALNTGVTNPMSKVTVQSFKDIGYVVNSASAETYVLPAPAQAFRQPGTLRFFDDVWRGPIFLVDENGTVVGMLRR